MSESSEIYSRWYDTVTRAGDDAIHMTNNHRNLPAPSERAALARRALRQPGDAP